MNDCTKIPYGYCQCGCGQKTRIAPKTDRQRGWVRGEPIAQIRFHFARPKEDCSVGPVVLPGCVVIPLTKGYYAIVDEADAERVLAHSWCAVEKDRVVYAQSRVSGVLVFLHNFLVEAPTGQLIDHENSDGLDCRRANLRNASNAGNSQNTRIRSDNRSGFRGVHWSEREGCWIAAISASRRRRTLGRFDDPVRAAKAYDDAARELHGEFARLNFPAEGEQRA